MYWRCLSCSDRRFRESVSLGFSTFHNQVGRFFNQHVGYYLGAPYGRS
jgi:hypothetical protein